MRDFGIFHRTLRLVCVAFLTIILGNCKGAPMLEDREYSFTMVSNDVVYDNNSHAAFTGLSNHSGKLYLAFREGVAHRPATEDDYGRIKILVNDGIGWKENAVIADKTKDLRDPFLVEMEGGKLRAYIGYNTFEARGYQHSGSAYADYDGQTWSEVKPVNHDVPHIVWLWKVRRYGDTYYSVAYLEGEYPALLSSKDGAIWKTVTLFNLEGVLSEADMCFIGNTMYVCLRKDQPIGSPSYWGTSKYPFTDFTWTGMAVCIESPELMRLPSSKSLLLAGRERRPSSDVVDVSLYSVDAEGALTKITTFISEEKGGGIWDIPVWRSKATGYIAVIMLAKTGVKLCWRYWKSSNCFDMKILAITQARYGSTRLPAKVLKEVDGATLLEIHLRRILQSKMVTGLKVATTDEEGSKFIIDICNKVGVEYHQGSVDDVLDRFYQTALSERPDYVVRVTSDCPLIDPDIIDQVIKACIDGGYDYASNTLIPTYPDGMDVECFTFAALEKAWKEAALLSEHEHVTPYIKNNSTVMGGTLFKSFNVENDVDLNEIRITVDEPRDFEVIRTLIREVGIDKHCADYVAYLDAHEEVKDINSSIMRNEGYIKSLANDKQIR